METIEIIGEAIPRLGLGTWNMRGESGLKALLNAFEIGYRHIDTAEMYRNEEIIGEAIARSGVARNEFFVTTKAWSDRLTHAKVKRACEDSLSRLGMHSVDLFLIHRPGSAPLEETLTGMQELVAEGKTRYIGVSNFSVEQMERAIHISGEPIFTNQVSYHIYNQRDELLKPCRKNGAALTAYTPLANGRVMRDKSLNSIGERYGKSAAQVALRWLIQQEGVITIPKAATDLHQRANMDIFDFELSDQEMQEIHNLR